MKYISTNIMKCNREKGNVKKKIEKSAIIWGQGKTTIIYDQGTVNPSHMSCFLPPPTCAGESLKKKTA